MNIKCGKCGHWHKADEPCDPSDLGLPTEAGFYQLKKLYYELIYAVSQKCPNETRHQTALRYIMEREQSKSAESGCKMNLVSD